ncbi:B3/B4 tRNA-binding domain-containing protein [Rozella allomycis CSF55]|uniref:phenylalanine--tRNA ligase n=1 Tax=Rozella allomycis (strain CSF55) TaxID=988480 RepID=A0A075AN13_ROZAC|nr:B3/B4 tRNA-binding domain-containing protein [Rozella allomycis CSF55]|eukprot:EPZ31164.1 B3/B4 tRNA-binding domain-containing protein [Rozella allomycis CSF55]
MPSIEVKKKELFDLGDKDFDLLCFDFGIEVDEILEDAYKIDIPANRALRIFVGGKAEKYKTIPPKLELKVDASTKVIRPYCVAAVLRNVTFNETNYASFIYLQEKLHQNLCRKRSLVAIGTHDLDTIQGPFKYEAKKPEDISFVPLNQKEKMDGNRLMEFYQTDNHLKHFLHLIRDSPVFPVITDANGTVLSLPPIINGDHSKITLSTKNVFIECTATDFTKAKMVLDTMVCMFAEYCKEKFTVEQVTIKYDEKTLIHPEFDYRQEIVPLKELIRFIGVPLTAEKASELLTKMSLDSYVKNENEVVAIIPPTRSDILHACDICEDLSIAYGYNNIPKVLPPTNTIGKPFMLNKITDAIRREIAFAGYTEGLTLTLTAVTLSNPKSIEYQVVRTSLLPGLLKKLFSNIKCPLPIKLFEVADVVLLDESKDVRARNERKIAALYCNKTSDRIMLVLNVSFDDYSVVPSDEPFLFPSRRMDVIYKGSKIGYFGILHPQVLKNYEIPFVCSALEIDLEPFV